MLRSLYQSGGELFHAQRRILRKIKGEDLVLVSSRMMTKAAFGLILFLFFCPRQIWAAPRDLSGWKEGQKLGDLQLSHLFSDSNGAIRGGQFIHLPTGAPIYFIQVESVPQMFTWVSTPVDSNQGLPHSLEHILLSKGTKGRYYELLTNMRLSRSGAGTAADFVYYGFSSGAGTAGFFELFHALLESLYRPDFSDLEAEREFYHLSVASDRQGKKSLIESGTVYNEMLAREDLYNYYYEVDRRIFGDKSPLRFESGGSPSQMRGVTPAQIQQFYKKWYRIGPTTGFIFSFPPSEDAAAILRRISQELQQFAPTSITEQSVRAAPKDASHASDQLDPGIYPFPGINPTAPGTVQLAWKPAQVSSLLNLKLLELFCRGLGGGEHSLLQKAIVDSNKGSDQLGATGIDCSLLPESDLRFPVPGIEITGIPGNQITTERMQRLRDLVLDTIRQVSQYPDHSPALLEFNDLIAGIARNDRRSEDVWTKSPPGFGSTPPKKDWKRYFERLQMDPSFVRSLTQERVWQGIEKELASGRNIWRELIEETHLQAEPYITAGIPSPVLLQEIEKGKQKRVGDEVSRLMAQYGTQDEQGALTRFDEEERTKSQKIDQIEAAVPRPRFTEHPPLVPDAELRYREFRMGEVPVIASVFDRPPTIDIGLSFDLKKIPSRFYKYLPFLPECLTSLGLKKESQLVSHTELSARIQREVYAFSAAYETNPVSKRADFTIRASATSVQEFQRALNLIRDTMSFNYLDPANVGRMRDILKRHIAADQVAARQDSAALTSANAFFYQSDPLYLGLHSRFTITHWDERLLWRLHEPVNRAQIDDLGTFANNVLSPSVCSSRQQLSQHINELGANDLEHELLEYWKRNLYSFPETELCEGFRKLTAEVKEDLLTGIESTIRDLKELQRLVLNRRALHMDVTLSALALTEIQPSLSNFLGAIPVVEIEEPGKLAFVSPVAAALQRRYHSSSDVRPLYLAVVNPDLAGGDLLVYSDFPGYLALDRKSIIKLLAANLFAGAGPHSFFAKAWERGLAYQSQVNNNPGIKLIWYFANKSPDLTSLLKLVNSMAAGAAEIHDPHLLDYLLSQMFSLSRETSTTSERGKEMAHDLRDGNGPDTIRRFSEAVQSLRKEPHLLESLTANGLDSICGVLLRDNCRDEQRAGRSVFFFVGPEKILSGAEQQIPIPDLKRLYASDFWMD
jgi:Zn-dependent M16 (insulinase) family peptidase